MANLPPAQPNTLLRYNASRELETVAFSRILDALVSGTPPENPVVGQMWATTTPYTPGQVATPTFSPVAGTYEGTQSVTILCATAGAEIRYTTDGSTPTAASTLYSAPISVAVTTTIKAIALKAAMIDSAVGTAAYTIPVVGLLDFETTNLTPIGRTGAYSNDVPWNGVRGAARDGTIFHGGAYSMKFVSTAGTEIQLIRAITMPASGNVTLERWFRYAPGGEVGTVIIAGIANPIPVSAWSQAVFFLPGTGICHYNNAYGPVTIVAAASLAADTWYRVVATFDCTDNTVDATVYASDGTTSLGSVTAAAGPSPFSGIARTSIVGRSTTSITYWVDDMIDGV